MEEYRDIKGYEGKYQVSNLGNVRSVKRNIVLKQQPNLKSGYVQVVLWKNSKALNVYVHRLVAMAFLDNVDNHPYVGHLNGDKLNNTVENLYFCNRKPQVQYKKKNEQE